MIVKDNDRYFNYTFDEEQLKADVAAAYEKYGKVYIVMNEFFEDFFYSIVNNFSPIEKETKDKVYLKRWADYYNVRTMIDNSLKFGKIQILGTLYQPKRYEYSPYDILSLADLRKDAGTTVWANEWTKNKLEEEKEYFEDNSVNFVKYYNITIKVDNDLEDGVLLGSVG